MENEEIESFENEEIVEENEGVEEKQEENITLDDYYKIKKELEDEKNARKKTEKKLVEYKKEAKGKVIDNGDEVLTKTDYEIKEFVKENPQYQGKEDEIKTYLKKGLDIKQVSKIVEPDESFENREKTKKSSIGTGDFVGGKTIYSQNELEKMSQKDYENVMNLYEKGKVKITG